MKPCLSMDHFDILAYLLIVVYLDYKTALLVYDKLIFAFYDDKIQFKDN